jgi:NAD(P)-dependent dehydrogenase (short-subunit alcohol dehydrogenase family)
MRLQDKVAIITGAGGGMGRVAAQLFAAEGARVVVAEYGDAAGRETVDLVRGVFLGCKYAIPAMVDGGGGSIINIASFVAILGCSVPQDAYTASKGAILSLTRSLAVQFGPNGIRTNAICPGPIETPLLMDWLLKDEAAKNLRLARNPTGRFGKPEEIVFMALYLASDESRFTNGASLVVDGGISVNYF